MLLGCNGQRSVAVGLTRERPGRSQGRGGAHFHPVSQTPGGNKDKTGNGTQLHTVLQSQSAQGLIRGGLAVPLLEVGRGDERSAQVAVAHPLGLPPGGVLLAYDLENVPPLERKPRLLARCGFVLVRCVVEQSPEVNLSKTQMMIAV